LNEKLITKVKMIGESFASLFQYLCIVHEDKEDKIKGNIVAIVIVSIGNAIIYRHNKTFTPETILKDVPKIFEKYKMYDVELIIGDAQ